MLKVLEDKLRFIIGESTWATSREPFAIHFNVNECAGEKEKLKEGKKQKPRSIITAMALDNEKVSVAASPVAYQFSHQHCLNN